jgi:hypothetical protein
MATSKRKKLTIAEKVKIIQDDVEEICDAKEIEEEEEEEEEAVQEEESVPTLG